MGAYEEDYKTIGNPIQPPKSRGSSHPQGLAPDINTPSRVTYDVGNMTHPGAMQRQSPGSSGYTPREAWPEHQQSKPLSKAGWDPSIPRTPPVRSNLPVTPIERHRTMSKMLAQEGKASSPLKARQNMMQTVNNDVQMRMSMLMDSVGYGSDGNHLSHQIVAEGNMAMDDDMTQIVGETSWLQEASEVDLEPQPWELPQAGKPMFNMRNPILPGIDEQVIGSQSGSLVLPPMSKRQESQLTGSQGDSLEACLGRWNALGNMVDTMTAASRKLASLDRQRDQMKSQFPIGSRNNPSERALRLRTERRNSRSGDPGWEQWGSHGGAA